VKRLFQGAFIRLHPLSSRTLWNHDNGCRWMGPAAEISQQAPPGVAQECKNIHTVCFGDNGGLWVVAPLRS